MFRACVKRANKVCLIVGVGWREVEMLVYANILKSETTNQFKNKGKLLPELTEFAIHSFL